MNLRNAVHGNANDINTQVEFFSKALVGLFRVSRSGSLLGCFRYVGGQDVVRLVSRRRDYIDFDTAGASASQVCTRRR